MDNRETVLHATALKRNSDAEAIAGLAGLPSDVVAAELAHAVATGRAVDAAGKFTLTPLADVALRSRYSLHYAHLRTDPAFLSAYEAFERINGTLKAVITDWQTMSVGGKAVANDHSDPDYDARIIDRLGTVHEQIEPVIDRLATGLPRLKVYGNKLLAALEAAEDGEHAWVSDIRRESYHTVWFELHEDLLRIMAREREE
jgi:hypothetical protein